MLLLEAIFSHLSNLFGITKIMESLLNLLSDSFVVMLHYGCPNSKKAQKLQMKKLKIR